jgi:hypothetical protein
VLGEFQLGDVPATVPGVGTAGAAAPPVAQPAEVDDEWARMLQEGMRDLLKDVDENVSPLSFKLHQALIAAFPSTDGL